MRRRQNLLIFVSERGSVTGRGGCSGGRGGGKPVFNAHHSPCGGRGKLCSAMHHMQNYQMQPKGIGRVMNCTKPYTICEGGDALHIGQLPVVPQQSRCGDNGACNSLSCISEAFQSRCDEVQF